MPVGRPIYSAQSADPFERTLDKVFNARKSRLKRVGFTHEDQAIINKYARDLADIIWHDPTDTKWYINIGRGLGFRGKEAAKACSQHWVSAGREVRRLTPKRAGIDFNDILLKV
jgi:hypothetical protein